MVAAFDLAGPRNQDEGQVIADLQRADRNGLHHADTTLPLKLFHGG